jgi:hypothetical protein
VAWWLGDYLKSLYAGPVPWRLFQPIIAAMTSRLTSSKLLLIADSRSAAPASMAVPIRRYRIARLRLDGRPTSGSPLGARKHG